MSDLPAQPKEPIGPARSRGSWLEVVAFNAASYVISALNEVASVVLAKTGVVSKTGGALIAGATGFVSSVLRYYGLYEGHDTIKDNSVYRRAEGALLGLVKNRGHDAGIADSAATQADNGVTPQK